MPRIIRKMAMILACALVVETALPATTVYARDRVDIKAQNATAKGNISTTIRFDYPFAYDKVKEQDIRVILKKGHESIVEIQLGNTPQVVKNIGDYPVEIIAQNTENVEITTEDVIGSYYINVKNLELGTYQFVYEGDGYKTYTSNDIVLSTYSKNVAVGTAGNNLFSYGDIDGNNAIEKADLEKLEEVIKKGDEEAAKKYDINGDDKVDIVELTYINQQLETEGKEVQTDAAVIISQDIIATVDESIKSVGLEITEGSAADLFTGGSQVKIEKTSDEGELEIPLNLGEKGIETEAIELVSPGGDGALKEGTLIVEDVNGDIQEYSFSTSVVEQKGVRVITRASEERSKIVINLGKRVPVKRVTISVKEVEGENGAPSYVVMEEVSFVRDIASNVSTVDKSAIKNVTLTEKDKEVVLEWDPVANVEGYKVVYGEKPGSYPNELNVDTPYASVEGLENLKTYYFKIRATSGEWMGTLSEEYTATPQPSKAPLRPDNLKVESMDRALTLRWQAAEDATYYKVFYKKAIDEAYSQFMPQDSADGKVKGTSVAIGGLENNVEYELYVIAGNSIGESGQSLVAVGTPKKVAVDGPELPTKNKISMDQIENIVMKDKGNIDWSQYPNGFNTTYDPTSDKDGIKNIVDGDFSTHWTAKAGQYWLSEEMVYTFKEPIEMNYLIYVDRLDRKYNQNWNYTITVWEDGDDLSSAGKKIVGVGYTKRKTDEEDREYYIVEFPKHNVKKISVQVEQASYSSISEIAFYKYDSLADDIAKLFTNGSFTKLAEGVNQAAIDALRARLNSEDAYYVEHSIFEEELNLAEALLVNDNSKLGTVKEGLVSINTSGDAKKINDWSPLGVVGYAGKQMVVYADIPQGETVELIPTQYYAEASALAGSTIKLTKGRNVIDISKIGSHNQTAGGSFYYRYSGQNGDQIKLQIRSINNSVVQIPTLELYDWYSLNETARKERISKYIDELVAYAPDKLANKTTNPANATEISGRNVLLSLPADRVLEGITAATPTKEAQIEKLYDNMLAWEETIEVVHTTYGLDNPLQALKSRQNIRYMRMFGKAFMYAAGSHIGVEYGSTSALVQGKPTSVTGTGNANGLFGWGIGHEIGHNMDRLGKAEITNNIYSILLQTYDGKDNTLPSRLEGGYESIYKKVAIGDKGMSNDVFTQLGMYWQLHLAYDNGADDKENGPLSFYNKLFKVYDSGAVNNFSGDEKFAVAASVVAKRDLTEFFTKWGVELSDAAKAEMQDQGQKEERKIQYLTDESRRYRLNGGAGIQAMELTATAEVATASNEGTNTNAVNITINAEQSGSKDLLGYEIFRDGKQIAFITGTTYQDVVGSANNKAFKYEVRAIDALGNIINKDDNNGKVSAGSVRIEHDNVIDSNQYDIKFISGNAETTTGPVLTTTGPALVLTFTNKTTPVTGIRVKAKDGSALPEGAFKIEIGRKSGDEYSYTTAKEGNFADNQAVDTSKFINYFNKPGVSSEDTRIWTYDADVIRITGDSIDETFLNKFVIEPLSYPGDNVAFEDYKVGILGEDYEYQDGEGTSVIEKGTLIVVGSYRGDPLYNTIQIKGKYAKRTGEDDTIVYEDRTMDGELLMFAEIPKDGETSDISDGLFIFIPTVQKEEGEPGDGHEHGAGDLSALPTQIMATMFRYDTIDNTGTSRVTSTTLWYATPSYDSMPEIFLNQGVASLMEEAMYEEN